MLLFRKCLNTYGWTKKRESEALLAGEKIKDASGNELETEESNAAEFSRVNNAEHAPEVCNEFVTVFLDKYPNTGIDRGDSIDLTRNLCHWIYTNGHTCSKLSMVTGHVS